MERDSRSYFVSAVMLGLLFLIGLTGWLARYSGTAQASFQTGSLGGSTSYGNSVVVNETLANGVVVLQSYKNDVSPPLRDMPQIPIGPTEEHEANANPRVSIPHADQPDTVVQHFMAPLAMPTPILTFNGIPYPGVGCNCAPPDTNGEAGATQYVQMVNDGYQVFNKATGASVLGPASIESIWSGFGGACENNGFGDPVVLYDQLANRWLISEFASPTGGLPITDECIAVSTSSDATGSWYRYGYHLGSNYYDYPHLGLWPDAYYMSMNVFNAAGTTYLGPQPFAFDRTRMLTGLSATGISPVGPLGGTVDPSLPADLDGSNLPTAGAPETFVRFPGTGLYTTYHFHVDFTTPGNSTWTTFANPAAAGYTDLCPSTRACVPQSGSPDNLDGIGDRLMFRLAYRKFADGHESVVSNYTVSSSGVAAVRWFELRNVTAGPVTVYQESTYHPDSTWRWMGSIAMDHSGDIALGFSASSASIHPQIRYAGRLVTDPLNNLSQGEAHLFDGAGSQLTSSNRWGDYSDMTIDPADDCTFWYTQEYYATTSSYNWRTRIGKFKFPGCVGVNTPTPNPTATRTPTRTPTRTHTPAPSQTPGGPTATTTATPTSCPIQFTDVPIGSTFYTWVRCLACRGIINGYPDGTFKPNNNVTRGQLSKIVSNSAGFSEAHSERTFEDVTVGSTFHQFIERLASRGIISGYACGSSGEPCVPPDNRPYFRPNNPVTRGQTSKITAIAASLPDPPPGTQTFEDVTEGSTFWQWIEALASTGAISGYPCGGVGEPCVPPGSRPYFRPNNNVSRGQSSKIVANTFFPGCQTP